MMFTFHGGNEYVKVNIITREKILVATSKTGYKFEDVSNKFYDNRDEKARCLRASEEDYKAYVILQFAGRGYKLIKFSAN